MQSTLSPARGAAHQQRHPRALAALVAAAVAAGCAAPADNPVHTDVHCVAWRKVTITVQGRPHEVNGACTAWEVGPTPKEREAWDKLHGLQPEGGAR